MDRLIHANHLQIVTLPRSRAHFYPAQIKISNFILTKRKKNYLQHA